jgi:hypothetical protein
MIAGQARTAPERSRCSAISVAALREKEQSAAISTGGVASFEA